MDVNDVGGEEGSRDEGVSREEGDGDEGVVREEGDGDPIRVASV